MERVPFISRAVLLLFGVLFAVTIVCGDENPHVDSVGFDSVDDFSNSNDDLSKDQEMPRGLIAAAIDNHQKGGPSYDPAHQASSEGEFYDENDHGHFGEEAIGSNGPIIHAIRLDKDTVDVSSSAVNVTLIVDFNVPSQSSFEGKISAIHASLHSEEHEEQGFSCVPGDITATPFHCVFTIPRYSASGKWILRDIGLHDTLERSTHMSYAELKEKGFDVHVTLTGEGDLTPPTLSSVELTTWRGPGPKHDDLHHHDEGDDTGTGMMMGTNKNENKRNDGEEDTLWLNVTITVEDDKVGFGHGEVLFIDAKGNPTVSVIIGEHNRISGDAKRGTYRGSEALHKHAPGGTWYIQEIRLHDEVQNTRKYDTMRLNAMKMPRKVQIDTVSDHLDPELKNFEITGADPKGRFIPGSTVKFKISAFDDLSGVAHIVVRVQALQIHHDFIEGTAIDHPKGGIVDTVVALRIPLGAPAGKYRVMEVIIMDDVGNQVSIGPEQFQKRSFEMFFKVDTPTAEEQERLDKEEADLWSDDALDPLHEGQHDSVDSDHIFEDEDVGNGNSATTKVDMGVEPDKRM